MLELMNIYKTELKKLIVLHEGWLCLGPGCGRDDWTVVGEGGREGEWKTVATADLCLTHLMVFTDWRCASFELCQ